jgi:hypothetical protein
MEVWKDSHVIGYSVSSLGKVKSCARLVPTVKGKNGYLKINERMLRQEPYNDKYLRVALSYKGKVQRISVHRLVASVFIPNPGNKPCVNHIDGNAENNCIENLEWCTYSENENHSYKILGKINPRRKLTIQEVNEIKSRYIKGKNQYDNSNSSVLAKEYGVEKSTIKRIVNGSSYK